MRPYETYETTQPWVCYTYGATHDRWWPLWSSTHVLGRSKILMECCVCGNRTMAVMKIPRFGPIPDRGPHPVRTAYLADHAHPDRGHPMSWARPLRNMAMHAGGMNLDLLGARLEADLNDSASAPSGGEERGSNEN